VQPFGEHGFEELMKYIAYTHYSFFEWGLIFLDILYDSVAKLDLEDADLQVCVLHRPSPEPEVLINLNGQITLCPTRDHNNTSAM
jgi:hypothetical protein